MLIIIIIMVNKMEIKIKDNLRRKFNKDQYYSSNNKWWCKMHRLEIILIRKKCQWKSIFLIFDFLMIFIFSK